MHIVLLEPYFTGSHQTWAEEYAGFSSHAVTILKLPGRFWKWRMHGGAISLARQFLALPAPPDFILATDMLDLTTFLALTRPAGSRNIPCAVYFHENQLTYPWSAQDRDVAARRDSHYGFINLASALAADAVFFNSPYHLESFLAALPRFLNQFPDFNELETIETIRAKAAVLPLGLNLRQFDAHRPAAGNPEQRRRPLILWNHRWEYDKNPAEFFEALYTLADAGLEFEVAVLGQNFRNRPAEFERARQQLGSRIAHFGYVETFAEYAAWLWRATILPVTSHHDFFGAGVVQAIYCRTIPLLPHRLTYPRLLPAKLHPHYLYRTHDEFVQKLAQLLLKPGDADVTLPAAVSRFDWSLLAARYDTRFEQVTVSGPQQKG